MGSFPVWLGWCAVQSDDVYKGVYDGDGVHDADAVARYLPFKIDSITKMWSTCFTSLAPHR